MLKRYIFTLVITAILNLSISIAHAEFSKAKTANFTNNIAAGELVYLRLKKLPKHSKIHIDASTNGTITIALIKADSNDTSTVKKPIFESVIEDYSSFNVASETFGDYFILLDNRKGDKKRRVKLSVTVSKSDSIINATNVLVEFEKTLHQFYKFTPVKINADACNTPNAYSTPVGIILCERYIESLYIEIEDAQKTKDVILFTIFHEFGHTLLQQWGYSFYDSEDYADQFATASLIMLQKAPRLQATVDLFNSRPTTKKQSFESIKSNIHALSKDRAKRLSQWQKDPNFIVKWQRLLFPHIQTTFLEKMYSTKPAWLDKELTKQEIARRR